MDEKTLYLLLAVIAGYVLSFFCGYLVCKCRKAGLVGNTDICGELNESLGDSTERVENLETGLGELTEEGKRTLDIFRKYLHTDEQDKKLEQDTDRDNISELDFERHTDSAFSAIDDEDE